MINYRYLCSDKHCQYEFEVQQSIKDEAFKLCPSCDEDSLERVIHAVPTFIKDGETKTLGDLAQRNTDKLGRYTREEMWGLQAEKKKLAKQAAREQLEASLPPGASLPKLSSASSNEIAIAKKIQAMGETQKLDYIKTGKL